MTALTSSDIAFLDWMHRHPHLVSVHLRRTSRDPTRISPDSRVLFTALGARTCVSRSLRYTSYARLVSLGYLVSIFAPLRPLAANHAPPPDARTYTRGSQPRSIDSDPSREI